MKNILYVIFDVKIENGELKICEISDGRNSGYSYYNLAEANLQKKITMEKKVVSSLMEIAKSQNEKLVYITGRDQKAFEKEHGVISTDPAVTFHYRYGSFQEKDFSPEQKYLIYSNWDQFPFKDYKHVRYVNNTSSVYEPATYCNDKAFLTYLAKKHPEVFPKTILIQRNNPEDIHKIDELKFPIVIKPVDGVYGQGVIKLENKEQTLRFLDGLKIGKFDPQIGIQPEFLEFWEKIGKDGKNEELFILAQEFIQVDSEEYIDGRVPTLRVVVVHDEEDDMTDVISIYPQLPAFKNDSLNSGNQAEIMRSYGDFNKGPTALLTPTHEAELKKKCLQTFKPLLKTLTQDINGQLIEHIKKNNDTTLNRYISSQLNDDWLLKGLFQKNKKEMEKVFWNRERSNAVSQPQSGDDLEAEGDSISKIKNKQEETTKTNAHSFFQKLNHKFKTAKEVISNKFKKPTNLP